MNFLENITFRRSRVRTHSDPTPPHDDSDVISHTLEGTTSSLPDISGDEDCDQVRTLKEEIQILQSQLSSAHSEIELLNQENSKLKLANDDLSKKNQVYKKITTGSPAKTARNQSTPKKKNPTNSKTKGTQTDTSDITNFSIEMGSHINKSQNKEPQQPPKKKKICVLSTDTNNHVLTTAQRVLINDKDEICHYLTPKVGIEHLLRGIESKLVDFTIQDYCIVLIGQEDFKITKDYHKMIINIRDVLQKIKHTNIILCFPTYTFRSHNSLHNARIETFNNLLYLDLLVHEHAYHLDSNKNLTADLSMFKKKQD